MLRYTLAALALLAPSAVGAQSLDPANPNQIARALQDMGFRAEMDPYNSGRPRIRSSIEGISFSLAFYSCRNDHTDCGSLLFVKGYDMSKGLSYTVANKWNADRLIGRVYLDDENDPFIDYFVDAEFGITRGTFEDVVEGWGRALVDFEEEIGWER